MITISDNFYLRYVNFGEGDIVFYHYISNAIMRADSTNSKEIVKLELEVVN